MQANLVLAALLVTGIGGTGRAAPLAPVPVHAAPSHVALWADVVDRDAAAKPAGGCESIAAGDRASCRKLEAAFADARRTLAYADLSEGLDAGRRAALARLIAAQETYAKAVGATGSDGDAGTAEQIEKDAFLKTLRTMVRGEAAPVLGEVDGRAYAALDAGLNAAYALAMDARDAEAHGAILDKPALRRAERAWLVYRDAFVAFAATSSTPRAADIVKAELTRRRTADLEALLAD